MTNCKLFQYYSLGKMEKKKICVPGISLKQHDRREAETELSMLVSRNAIIVLQSFTETLAQLISLLDKRQHNLIDSHQREHIIVAMTTLKKCVPMLKSSMQTFVKYPKNPQVLVSDGRSQVHNMTATKSW